MGYVGDSAPEKLSPTRVEPLVSYVGDRLQGAPGNRRYVAPGRHGYRGALRCRPFPCHGERSVDLFRIVTTAWPIPRPLTSEQHRCPACHKRATPGGGERSTTVIKGSGQPTLKCQLTCWYALSAGGARWNRATDFNTTLLRPTWKKSGLLPGILWGQVESNHRLQHYQCPPLR